MLTFIISLFTKKSAKYFDLINPVILYPGMTNLLPGKCANKIKDPQKSCL